jgi:hypothetical protein
MRDVRIVSEEYPVNTGLVSSVPYRAGKVRIQYHRSAARTQHPSHLGKSTDCLRNIICA